MKRSSETLQILCLVAVMAIAVGAALMWNAWPDTELVREASTSVITGEVTPARYEETGSTALAALGGLLAWAGQCALLVSLVGWGVMLGQRAAGVVTTD